MSGVQSDQDASPGEDVVGGLKLIKHKNVVYHKGGINLVIHRVTKTVQCCYR